MSKNEFVAYVIGDQLAELSDMSARAMFGGFGLYRDGTIVGIISEDELYLKVDESNVEEYKALGSAPFSYTKKDGKSYEMSYWKVPAEILEDRARLVELVLDSFDINLRKALKKKPLKKKKRA